MRRGLTEQPHLSLILPAYRAADYIEDSINTVLDALSAIGRPFEVLVVCDGPDGSEERARSVVDPRVRVFSYPENRGKGYAICFGVAQARGRLIGWLDSDLDIHPRVIVEAVSRFDQGDIDAVIGSKRHPRSAVNYPPTRRVLSWGFQLLVRALFRINVRDTQVGAKLFRSEMLSIVAPLLVIKRYAFDLEVLAVGAEFGFDRIEEVPVQLDYRFTGTGINSSSVQRMFIDMLAIAYRIHLRHWYVRQFASHERRRIRAGTDEENLEAPPQSYAAGAIWSEIVSPTE